MCLALVNTIQERMTFGGCVISKVVRVEHGSFDRKELEQHLTHLVEIHEPLRTRVDYGSGDPETALQEVMDPTHMPTPTVTEHVGDSRGEEIAISLREEMGRDFGANPPFIRAALFDCPPAQQLLALSIDHDVGDYFTLSILLRQLAELRETGATGAPSLSYSAFAEGQRAVWDQPIGPAQDKLTEAVEHWVKVLSAATISAPPRELTGKSTSATRSQQRRLSVEACEAIRAQIPSGVTPFMWGLAALGIVLAHLRSDNDVAIITLQANRAQDSTRDLVGFLAEPSVIRFQVDWSLSFLEQLQVVRDASLTAYEHFDVPFLKAVLDESVLQHSIDFFYTEQPLCIFQYFDSSRPIAVGEMRLAPIDIDDPAVRERAEGASSTVTGWPVEFHVTVRRDASGFVLQLIYDDQIWSAGSMAAVLSRIESVIHLGLAEPNRALRDIISTAGGT